jgi:hypothetical protein
MLFNPNKSNQVIKRSRENAGKSLFFARTGRKYSKKN